MQSKVCVYIYTFRRMREKAKERQIQLRSQFEISNISFSITFSIASIYVFSSSHSLLLILSLSLRFHQFCSHLLPPSLAHLSIYLYLCVLHTYAYIWSLPYIRHSNCMCPSILPAPVHLPNLHPPIYPSTTLYLNICNHLSTSIYISICTHISTYLLYIHIFFTYL